MYTSQNKRETTVDDKAAVAKGDEQRQRASARWEIFRERSEDAVQRAANLTAYSGGQCSFVPDLLPEVAVRLTAEETLQVLRGRFGAAVDLALDPRWASLDEQADRVLPAPLRSPMADEPDTAWLQRANMVGINVRTIGSFWNVVKYTLTVPHVQNAIHLLPVWEPGVVKSLYGMSSWEITPEFYSEELVAAVPALDSPSKQLCAVVHLLHLMGKAVGMEVIPHTDRYSEMVLAFPRYFEWIRRRDTEIVDHSANLHAQVERLIVDFLREQGPAIPGLVIPPSVEGVFGEDVPEERRLRLLVGEPEDYSGRLARRVALVEHLYRHGYEPLPATMGPPYRGLRVDPSEAAITVDQYGMIWRDFEFLRPEPMSRVFNPLARYKLYERRDDNADWEIDFDAPRLQVWRYVCDKYAELQQRFGFDFMRGDMSHVQMRAAGVPADADEHYDLLAAVRRKIHDELGVAYFGYFAEGFLAPRGTMAYGEEIDHLEASDAEVTLGDLQSTAVGTPEFLQRLRQYLDLSSTRSCKAAFTVATSDKDDPRFDKFYLAGNALRLFVATFLSDTASYVSLGFETRDIHREPAPNEHYTKLYVFHETSGPKATGGPFVWGRNGEIFEQTNDLRRYAEAIWPDVGGRQVRWLVHPDATGDSKLFAWTQQDAEAPRYVFVVNADTENALDGIHLPLLSNVAGAPTLSCEFSTDGPHATPQCDKTVTPGSRSYYLSTLGPAECRAYRVQ